MNDFGEANTLRVKTFQAKDIRELDEQINQWLKNGQGIRIVDRDYSHNAPSSLPSTQFLYRIPKDDE